MIFLRETGRLVMMTSIFLKYILISRVFLKYIYWFHEFFGLVVLIFRPSTKNIIILFFLRENTQLTWLPNYIFTKMETTGTYWCCFGRHTVTIFVSVHFILFWRSTFSRNFDHMNFYTGYICEVVEFQGATEVKNCEEDCLLKSWIDF